MPTLFADLRYALRRLRNTPGITAIAIHTLALGLGASTAMFTLTWNIVLKSLPVPRAHELVEYSLSNGVASPGMSIPLYTLLSARQQTLTGLLAFKDDANIIVRTGTRKSLQTVEMLTPNALGMLELAPATGQPLQGDATALLSEAYAREQFGSPARALGQTLAIAERTVTVSGVFPASFTGLTANLPPAIYLPIAFARLLDQPNALTQAGNIHFSVLGRLKPGVHLAQALAEAHALEPNLRHDADPSGIYLGQFFKAFRLTVRPGNSGNSWLRTTYQTPLLALELLVALLLVLCAANAALVMLARVSGRQHEYAVALALGAPRSAIARQVLIESLVLTLPALALGLLFGWAGAHTLVSMLGGNWDPALNPHAIPTRPDAVIFTVSAALTLLLALGTGLLPAWQAAGRQPAFDLKLAGRTVASRRAGVWSIALQVALSLAMVSAAWLLGGALLRFSNQHSGFDLDRAATATIDLSPLQFKGSEGNVILKRFGDALAAQPGVEATGFVNTLPLSGHYPISRAFSIDREHRIHSAPSLYFQDATPNYFRAAGTTVLATDPSFATLAPDKWPQSCALSRSLARIFFPGEDPLGRNAYFSTMGVPDGTNLDPKSACRIVAVVEDARYISLRQPATPMIYQFFDPSVNSDYSDGSGAEVMVRAASTPLAMAALRAALAATVPHEAIVRTQGFRERADADLGRERVLLEISASFALLALLLTGLGLHGLLMRSVALRQREIGIRLALGASRGFILVPLARPVLQGICVGLLAGSLLAALLTQALNKLFELPATSSLPGHALAVLSLVCISAVSLIAPALRAASTDPVIALRTE